MSDTLGLQTDLPEVPEEEKASSISVIGCTGSNHSVFLCYQK
ncbi:SapB/AmfS family lanthipeptide [Luteococcus sp.]